MKEGPSESLQVSSLDTHRVLNIEGWRVYFSKELDEKPELLALGEKEIRYQLFGVTRVLELDKLAKFREVPIWVELKPAEGQEINATYHPSKQWLSDNGVLTLKAKSVDIPELATFIRWSRESSTNIMLHELVHAYHHRVIGFDDEEIINRYEQAKKNGKYEEVLYFTGSRKRHYGITNPQEYFAEASEAYLGTNDYYPFTRIGLKEFDPVMFELMVKIWGKRK